MFNSASILTPLFLLVFFIIGINGCLYAQNQNYTIEHISSKISDDNLEVHSVCEDSYGFIWVAAKGTLIKYDGLSSVAYTSIEKDSAVLTIENAYSLADFTKENFLLGTFSNGLVRYEYATNKLYKIPLNPKNEKMMTSFIMDIEVDGDKNIWLSLSQGIIVLNKDFEIIYEFFREEIAPGYTNTDIFDVYASSWGLMYCSARTSGIYEFNDKQKAFIKIFPDTSDSFKDERFYRFAETDTGNLLISTLKNDILEISQKGELVNNYTISSKNIDQGDRLMLGLEVLDNTIVFGGINAGLHTARIGSETVTEIPVKIHPYSNKPVAVAGLMNDQFKNTWVANHRPGLFKINRNTVFQSHFENEPSNWLDDEMVNCVFETDSILWIGTDGGGLFIHNKKSNSFQQLTIDDGLSSNVITDIEFENKTTLWLATWGGGLSALNIETLAIQTFQPDPNAEDNAITFPNIKGILYLNDTLWIATHGNGVNLYIPETGKFISQKYQQSLPYDITSPVWGNKIISDSDGVIWVGAHHGLYAYKQGKTEYFYADDRKGLSLHDNRIADVFEDSDGLLWIGTYTGLQYFTKDRSEVVKIPKSVIPQGIVSIEEKSETELYLATNKGLYFFDKKELTVKAFTQEDGLPAKTFRERSVFKTNDETVYWGMGNGLCFYKDKKNIKHNYNPVVFLHSISITNEYDSVLLAKYNIFGNETYTIDYNHSRFDLHFGALGVPDVHRVAFSYRLDGIDMAFQDVENQKISYSRIAPGDYKLIIRAEYNGETYERVIDVTVTPPFWKTMWFYILIACLFILIISAGYWFRMKQLNDQKKKLQRLVDKRTIQLRSQNKALKDKSAELEIANSDLKLQGQTIRETFEELEDAYGELKGQSEELIETNQMLEKTTAFQQELMSVLAHDVKNSFASVRGFTSLIKEDNTKLNKYLPFIEKGVDSSALLLKNLVLWFKSQTDDLKVNKELFSLSKLIDESIKQNEAIAETKNITVKFSAEGEYNVEVDKNSFMLAIRNILHNALKFSEKNSEVVIAVKQKSDDEVAVSIKDFGSGMEQHMIDAFFKGERMISHSGTGGEAGTGLGLSLVKKYVEINNGNVSITSAKSSGTEFVVAVPLESIGELADVRSKDEAIIDSEAGILSEMRKKFKDYTILIVEDNSSFRSQLVVNLSRIFKVIETSNGLEALKVLRKQLPDLIITDYMMPKMKGDELSRIIKDDVRLAHIPIVMFSAVDEDKYAMQALQSGIDGYISKSENPHKLILKVVNIIHTRKHFKDIIQVETVPTQKQSEDSEESKMMERIYKILEENHSDPSFSVERLSELMAMERSHLYRKVKAASSKSPVELLNDFRLEKAKALILSMQYSVADVAYLSGFNAHAYFSKKFKQKFNQTPSEMLNQHK